MKETHIYENSVEPDGAALHIMMPETNRDESTYDGIDWGAERVTTEASILFILTRRHLNLFSTDFSGN